VGIISDFQLVQSDNERNKGNPIIVEVLGTQERRAGGKHVSTTTNIIGRVRGAAVQNRGTHNMNPGEDGIRFSGAKEFQVRKKDLVALGITELDEKNMRVYHSGMVHRVTGQNWLDRERVVRLFTERTRDEYPAFIGEWDFEADTIGAAPANCTTTVPEAVPDFGWHALGAFSPPAGSPWSLENIDGDEILVVEDRTYDGEVHRMLRAEWPVVDDNQAVVYTPPSKDVTEQLTFSFDLCFLAASPGWQHFCKFFNDGGVLVAELDQGSAHGLALMLGVDMFQEVDFTPHLTFTKGNYYRLDYIIYTTKTHRLNVHCYDDDTDYVGDLKNNDSCVGWAIDNISEIKFNRQADTPLKYRIAGVVASWGPAEVSSAEVVTDGPTKAVSMHSTYMGCPQVSIDVLDLVEGPAITTEFDIKITGAVADGVISRILLGEITDIVDLAANVLLYMIIERSAGVLHLKDLTGALFDTTFTASSWVHVKVVLDPKLSLISVEVGGVVLVDDIDVSAISATVKHVLFTGYVSNEAVVEIDNVEVDCVAR
jgi:hypothetical protein